jgi:hypothetical protein
VRQSSPPRSATWPFAVDCKLDFETSDNGRLGFTVNVRLLSTSPYSLSRLAMGNLFELQLTAIRSI